MNQSPTPTNGLSNGAGSGKERLMRPGTHSKGASPALALLLGSLFASAAGAAEQPTLERALVRQAPVLIKHFKDKGYQNVGVLKFLVSREGGKGFSDNGGLLNMMLAKRLEVALVLANDLRQPVGIIRNASAIAARTPKASYLNPAGRKKLFNPNYPLAWGKKLVKADAFVTGVAEISKDLRTMKVALALVDRDKNNLEPLTKGLEVRSDAGKLTEMNESFVLRGGFDNGSVKVGEKKHPLQERTPPVRLDVLYDDKPVTIEYQDGKAFVQEPKEGQKIAFRLRRDATRETYGVVLKVNGESTWQRERLPDLQCRKWILDPGSESLVLEGYQLDERRCLRFRVLSSVESKKSEINFGADVGTISLTVFRVQRKEDSEDPLPNQEGKLEGIVARGQLPQASITFVALRRTLLEKVSSRGLLGTGDSAVRPVKFMANPTPVMSATLVYYPAASGLPLAQEPLLVTNELRSFATDSGFILR
jgi:hypothetical protein